MVKFQLVFFYLEDRPKTCNHAYSLRIGFVGPIPFMAFWFMAYEGGERPNHLQQVLVRSEPSTPRKINMEHENTPLENRENHLNQTHHDFRFDLFIFREENLLVFGGNVPLSTFPVHRLMMSVSCPGIITTTKEAAANESSSNRQGTPPGNDRKKNTGRPGTWSPKWLWNEWIITKHFRYIKWRNPQLCKLI